MSRPIRGWLEQGREAIALGEIARARNGAGHLVQAARTALDGQNGTQKTAGVLVNRVGEQLLGGCLLDNLTGVHNRDVMGDLGDQRQVVRNKDHGKAELGLKVVEQLDDLLLNGNVQSGRGLVTDDQLGVAVRAIAIRTR